MRTIYSFLFFIFSIFYFPFFIFKGKHRSGLAERFGQLSSENKKKLAGKKVYWVHAVSVGEVQLALRLIHTWRPLFKGAGYLLTTTTVAGYEVASKSIHPDDALSFFPMDFAWTVRSFIRAASPAKVVMVETEIWPNLICELSNQGIPTYIMNGRISDRAISKYRLVRFFLRGILSQLSGIGVQDELMRDRFVELGAPKEIVKITGNIKYDWQPPDREPAEIEEVKNSLRAVSTQWFLAASTHEGEEAAVFDMAEAIWQKHPKAGILIAPRHIHRVSAIEELARQKGVALKKVFDEGKNDYDVKESKRVWLLDRMGWLAFLYEAMDIVFVGGSLAPIGGHNIVEPAFFAKPVLVGPHTENFLEMVSQFQKREAVMQVRDAADLRDKVLFLIDHPDERNRLGKAAQKVVREYGGALQKNTSTFFVS